MAKPVIAVLGIALGKTTCSLVGLDAGGAVVLRRRMRRETLIGFASRLSACVVAMEACCGAHHLGRLLADQGHAVRLMSPEYVRPYVKAQKNDDRDAEAIAEAATRPTMRFVALKRADRLDLQTLHRARDRLVGLRTMPITQLRAILLERGLLFPKGRRKLVAAVDALLAAAETPLGDRMRRLVADMRAERADLDRRIESLDREFVERAREDEATRRKPKPTSISRRGNAYLRRLFVHGARAALPSMAKADNATGERLRGLLARAHVNVVVVALAAKLARIAWATLRRGTHFAQPGALTA